MHFLFLDASLYFEHLYNFFYQEASVVETPIQFITSKSPNVYFMKDNVQYHMSLIEIPRLK